MQAATRLLVKVKIQGLQLHAELPLQVTVTHTLGRLEKKATAAFISLMIRKESKKSLSNQITGKREIF